MSRTLATLAVMLLLVGCGDDEPSIESAECMAVQRVVEEAAAAVPDEADVTVTSSAPTGDEALDVLSRLDDQAVARNAAAAQNRERDEARFRAITAFKNAVDDSPDCFEADVRVRARTAYDAWVAAGWGR